MSSIPPFPRLQRGKLVTNGLVGCWRMSEGSGLIANDISGRDQHLAISGATWTNGRDGSCLSCNGSSGYASVLGVPVDGAKEVSISAWLKTNSVLAGFPVSLPFNSVAGSDGVDIYFGSSHINATLKTTTAAYSLQSVGHVSTGVWYHVVLTYGNGAGILWIDAIVVASASMSGTINIQDDGEFNIGRFGIAGIYYNGLVDDVRIYNRALSDTEISLIYAGHG